jgi:hypothetical protein
MKTVIEVDTEDIYEVDTLISIISGYLNKREISHLCIGYIDCEDGRQHSIVSV